MCRHHYREPKPCVRCGCRIGERLPWPVTVAHIRPCHHFRVAQVFYATNNWGQFVVCDASGEDPTCSDYYKADLSIPDHLHYVGVDLVRVGVPGGSQWPPAGEERLGPYLRTA
jgi:hypothetical protein